MAQELKIPDVLTLEEAANYLRLPQDIIEKHAAEGDIPGRRVEETWWFLRAAIDEWLRAQDRRTVLLQQEGALADDESLTGLRDQIYAERGRPEAES